VFKSKEIVLIGNDSTVYDISSKLLSINNKLNLTIIVDGETIYNLYKETKPLTIPKIYCKVKRVDPFKKEVILSNGGVVNYDFLIIMPEVSLPFNIDENISGVYPLYDEKFFESIKNIAEKSFYLLVVGSISNELKENLEKLSKNLYIKDSTDIKEVKSFDGRVTSVLLKDETLIFADLILVTSYLRVKPSFLRYLGVSREKLELLNVYYVDSEAIHELPSTLSNLESKLKPEEAYMCPFELKVISECEYLENGYGLCEFYNTTVCRIQNSVGLKGSTIISRFIEGNITSGLNENFCDLCEFGSCKNDFKLCGEDDDIIYLRDFIRNSLKTLIFRRNLLSENLKLPYSVYETTNAFKHFNAKELKNLAKLVIVENGRILKKLSLRGSSIPVKAEIQEVDFNFGTFLKDKINILYISNKNSLNDSFFRYLRENANYNLICMGCGGIDISLNYGFPYLGSSLDEEFSVLTGLLDGVIIDEGCVLSSFVKKVYNSNIPILLHCRNTKEALSFLSTLKARERNSLNLNLSKNKAFIGLSYKHLDDLDVQGFVLFPGCSGSLLGGNFIKRTKDFLSQGYVLFASGCSLANLANLDYLGISPNFSSHAKIFGTGGFSRIYEIACHLKNKNLQTYTALEGIIKHDAILDSFTLKELFGFEIISSDKRVSSYINAFK